MTSMILLNECGDVTITWSEEHEEHMRELIEKKLKQGYSFFLIEPLVFGLIKQEVKVTNIDQIKRGTKLVLRDDDAIKLFEAGYINIEKHEKRKLSAKQRLDKVEEILKENTVAIRPIASG